MSVVGSRLRSARERENLSLRQFGEKFGEDFTLLARIEAGDRYPPKRRLAKYAKVLSLTPRQLEALIAIEKKGLNPHLLMPEVAPEFSLDWIEREAGKLLANFSRKSGNLFKLPIQIDAVIKTTCGLGVRYCDFETETQAALTAGQGSDLYGGLYLNGFRGLPAAILINTGNLRGKRISAEERRITIAHEAGHYVLHCANRDSKQLSFEFTKGPSFCRKADSGETSFSSLEYQASAFGACILMPQSEFLKEWHATPRAELSRIFGVTDEFVQLRAEMLGLGVIRE